MNAPQASAVLTEFLAELRRRLGVRADLNPTGILAALDEVLAEQVTTIDSVGATQGPVDGASAQLIAAALADGRVTPESAGFWQGELDADSTGRTAAVLASLPSVPGLGWSSPLDSKDTDDEYAALFGQEG